MSTASETGGTAASYYVKDLPGLPESSTLTLFSGQIPVGHENGEMYFLLAKNKHRADKERLVIWFNGGPGCSSFDGSFMEVGPLRMIIGGEGKLKDAEGSWNEYSHVLFIDQPLGTGYSTVDSNGYLKDLDQVGADVVEFMEKWLKIFPEHATQDTYLAGESFAGMYIPYIAKSWLASTLKTPLRGAMIGNGWMDPLTQYPAYLDFALASGLVKSGTSLEQTLINDNKVCADTMAQDGDEPMQIHYAVCEKAYTDIQESTIQTVDGKSMCINTYDIRLTDTFPECGLNWPSDLKDLTSYLNREDTREALHANTAKSWKECNTRVSMGLTLQHSVPSVQLFPELLEQIPMLLFAGDQDLICNYIGIENMIERITWNGKKGFGNSTKELPWLVNGKDAGFWKMDRNLTYVKVKDASHMVGYDKPLEAHDMLLRFMGVNLNEAVGPAAKIPSRLGDEMEVIVGGTHKNGTLVDQSTNSEKHSWTQSFNGTTSSSAILDKTGSLDAQQGSSSTYNKSFLDIPPSLIVLIILTGAALIGYLYRAQIRRRLMKLRSSTSGERRHAHFSNQATGDISYQPVSSHEEQDIEQGSWELYHMGHHESKDNLKDGKVLFQLGDDVDDD